ncbi:flagellar protein FlaG [Fontimonas sp. SYSU GA230001]|uniref:flagellar protein FlaG n=1 Tax=Fontimonas sp. SYSU GA230001 TaxID=3142450 RepID=UPI0032B44146
MTEAIQVASATAAPAGGGRSSVASSPPAVRQPSSPVDAAATSLRPKEASADRTEPATVRDVSAAAQELQRYARRSKSDLAFRVEADLNRVVVSVVDREDGTVLRQIPGEEALRIARAIAKMQEEGTGGLVQEVA